MVGDKNLMADGKHLASDGKNLMADSKYLVIDDEHSPAVSKYLVAGDRNLAAADGNLVASQKYLFAAHRNLVPDTDQSVGFARRGRDSTRRESTKLKFRNSKQYRNTNNLKIAHGV